MGQARGRNRRPASSGKRDFTRQNLGGCRSRQTLVEMPEIPNAGAFGDARKRSVEYSRSLNQVREILLDFEASVSSRFRKSANPGIGTLRNAEKRLKGKS